MGEDATHGGGWWSDDVKPSGGLCTVCGYGRL